MTEVPPELEWVHDCKLIRVAYEAATDERQITIEFSCPSDLGYAAWEGKTLVLTASDVVTSRHTMAPVGWATIDSIRPHISPEFERFLEPGREMGLRFPETAITIVLSG